MYNHRRATADSSVQLRYGEGGLSLDQLKELFREGRLFVRDFDGGRRGLLDGGGNVRNRLRRRPRSACGLHGCLGDNLRLDNKFTGLRCPQLRGRWLDFSAHVLTRPDPCRRAFRVLLRELGHGRSTRFTLSERLQELLRKGEARG